MSTTWWRAHTPRRRWTRLRPARQPGSARSLSTQLRVGEANLLPSPSSLALPGEVGWLLRRTRPGVGHGSAIHVAPRRDDSDLLAFDGPSTRPAPARAGGAPLASSPPEGPSLADRLRAILAVPIDHLLPGRDSVVEWPALLHPYQTEGVQTLLASDRLLLADDMGLGKTVQVAAAIRILCLQRAIRTVLLVVPASLVDQWRRELRRWAPELRVLPVRGTTRERAWQWRSEAHVTIVSYETLRSDAENPTAPVRQKSWDIVVLDEAQKIKNSEAGVARVCKALLRDRSWAMTGTPLENKLEDLASILEFVDHDPADPGRRYGPGEAMRLRHRELQLRRRKEDVLLELPPKQIIKVQLPLLPEQQAAYERAEREGVLQLQRMGPEIRIQHVLELILRLKQLCNFCPSNGESAKIADIAERLDALTEQGHRALLFSQFTDATFGVAAAAEALAAFDPLVFTGAMSARERDAVVDLFRSDSRHRVLALSLRAGGVGINLQEASYVFHLDRWWNPAVEEQATARSHRMGQQFPVTVFTYTAEGTIEERIDEIIAGKQQLFDEVVDDVTLDLSGRLTSDELFGLFDLDAPKRTRSGPSGGRPAGLDLEDRAARLLERRGWDVGRTPASRDGGVDLVARRIDEVGLEHRLFVQCKDYARPVGVDVVRELVGVLPPGEAVQAVLVSPAGVTADAARHATLRGVTVWDEARLQELEAADEG